VRTCLTNLLGANLRFKSWALPESSKRFFH